MGVLIALMSELPAWMLVSLGFYLAYRVLKFPDLTVDASFVTGTVGGACGAIYWQSSGLGLVLSVLLGMTAGACTGLIYLTNPRPAYKLLASVLVLLGFYSINYRVLGYRVEAGFANEPTAANQLADFEAIHGLTSFRPLSLAIGVGLVITACTIYGILLRTDFGLMLRSLGTRPWLASQSRIRSSVYLVLGLVISNATVAVGGWLYASINSFASVNVFGTILHALAAALMGEVLVERIYRGPDRRVAVGALLMAPLCGAIVYQTLRAFGAWIMVTAATSDSQAMSVNQQDYNTVVSVLLVLIVVLVRWLTSASRRDLIGADQSNTEGD